MSAFDDYKDTLDFNDRAYIKAHELDSYLRDAVNAGLEAAIKAAAASVSEYCDLSWNDACKTVIDDIRDLKED